MIANYISKRALAFGLIILFGFSNAGLAQDNSGDMDQLVSDSKNDLLVVVSGGLAGAILGLSTLSFVEEPKEHTRNILVGASIGIIAGVGYVAFSQANKSRDLLYGPQSYRSDSDFGTFARKSWHGESVNKNDSAVLAPLQVGYSFNY